jgi:arylsulfatase A-like enzyme
VRRPGWAVGRRRRLGIALAGITLAAVAGLVAVHGHWPRAGTSPAARGGTAAPRDVILISIDTLRASHLGCYGYHQPTTPNLDRFRQDAVLFREAIATAPSTLPSHASMMTSLLSRQHGASFDLHRGLSPRFLTIAGVFHQHGYRTVSFNDGGEISAEQGIGNGFDLYRSSRPTDRYHFADIVGPAIGWLQASSPGPLFLFLHTYEVHHPYTPDRRFLDLMEPPYRGPLPAGETDMATLVAINDGRLRAGPRDRAHVVATYDAEIRSMDEAFGRLLAFLRSRGRYDRALIVFTADHGEEFDEHGMLGWHAHTLYDELLRVPLLIKFPYGEHAGETVASQVRVIDIAPTLAAALGWPVPEQFRGADLTPLVLGRAAAPRFAVSRFDSLPTAAIRTSSWKLIGNRLYDLRSDPAETRDVAAQHPDIVRFLSRRLAALEAERPAASGPRVELTAEERDRLRSLGYLP